MPTPNSTIDVDARSVVQPIDTDVSLRCTMTGPAVMRGGTSACWTTKRPVRSPGSVKFCTVSMKPDPGSGVIVTAPLPVRSSAVNVASAAAVVDVDEIVCPLAGKSNDDAVNGMSGIVAPLASVTVPSSCATESVTSDVVVVLTTTLNVCTVK